jgi:hypothetical protein
MAATLLLGGAAQATPPERTEKVWYGWQVLAVDAASVVTGFAVGASTEAGTGALVWLPGYALGAPSVHLFHDYRRALGSLALRLGIPGVLVGFAAAAHEPCGVYQSASECYGSGWAASAGALALLGIGAAISIDAAALAWEPRPSPTSARLRLQFAPVHGGATAAVASTF